MWSLDANDLLHPSPDNGMLAVELDDFLNVLWRGHSVVASREDNLVRRDEELDSVSHSRLHVHRDESVGVGAKARDAVSH